MPRTVKNKIETEFKATDRFSRSVGVMSRGMQRLNRIAGRVKAGLMAVGRASLYLGRQAAHIAKIGLFAMAGAATAVFLSVTKLAGGMDELAKTTRAIDFDIEKYQEFKFAAEQSGVAGEKFGKSVTKFSKTVGELKGGYGAMFTALKKTNPQLLRQLKSTNSVSDAFELYLKAIRETPGAMNKAALATAGFGREGVAMINLANLQSDELENLRAQMRQNGIVTAEQAAKAEAFNDAMNRLKLTAKGLAVDALSPLMPMFESGADGLRGWIIQNRELISQKIHLVFEKIQIFGRKALNFLRTEIPPLIERLKKIGKDGLAWIRDNKEELREFGALVFTIGKMFVKVTGWIWKNKEAVLAAVISYKALGLSMSVLNWSGFMSGAGNASAAVGGLAGKVKGLAGMLGKGGLLFASFSAGWAVGSMIYEKWFANMDKLADKAQNTAAAIGLSVSRATDKQLDDKLNQMKKQQKSLEVSKTETGLALLNPFVATHAIYKKLTNREALKTTKQAQVDILTEKLGRMKKRQTVPEMDFTRGPLNDALKLNGLNSAQSEVQTPTPAEVMPQAQSTRTETIKTERVELIIKGDTEKAEIKRKPTSSGLSIPRFGTVTG